MFFQRKRFGSNPDHTSDGNSIGYLFEWVGCVFCLIMHFLAPFQQIRLGLCHEKSRLPRRFCVQPPQQRIPFLLSSGLRSHCRFLLHRVDMNSSFGAAMDSVVHNY